ncbi:MAG TPA: hypothetical protein VGH54_23905 [Mycobacterium sp.]|uniref:hypothetical protein n=1 Tax=Mycobacterium sp. TaxID=1785 RepID=UPI002F3E3968
MDDYPVVIEKGVDYAWAISYFLACAEADRHPIARFIHRGIDFEPTGYFTPAQLRWSADVDFVAEAHALAESIGMRLGFVEDLATSSETDGRYVLVPLLA